jgi:hypothetical protein
MRGWKMIVHGLNAIYTVEVKETIFKGKEAIIITCGNFVTGMTSVIISKESWEELKKSMEKHEIS